MRYLYNSSLLFLLFVTQSYSLHSEETKNSSTAPININNNNTVSPVITNYVTCVSYAIALSIQEIAIKYIDRIKAKIAETDAQLLKKMIQKFLWDRRYKIVAGTLIGCYGAVSSLLIADYYFLTHNTPWSLWKPECTLAQLCEIPQQQLEKELILTIGQRNFNQKNPTDFSHPLICFITEINTEMKTISHYITTAKTIKRLGLMRIFPTNDNKITHAERLLERAHFIKHIFVSWLAKYNLIKDDRP